MSLIDKLKSDVEHILRRETGVLGKVKLARHRESVEILVDVPTGRQYVFGVAESTHGTLGSVVVVARAHQDVFEQMAHERGGEPPPDHHVDYQCFYSKQEAAMVLEAFARRLVQEK